MKIRKQILCIILLCIGLALTGCGSTLFQLTGEEEEQIVLYSAKIVSKYNRAQEKGYSNVEDDTKDRFKENQEGLQSVEDKGEDAQGDEDQEQPMSFSDIMSIEGVSFTYKGYNVAQSFDTVDIAIPDADQGYSYLILQIDMANTSQQDLLIDLLNNPVKYKLSINGDLTVDCMTTLSMEDLSTYYNKEFHAGDVDETVLIFQTKTEYTQDISTLALQVTKDGQTYNVRL